MLLRTQPAASINTPSAEPRDVRQRNSYWDSATAGNYFDDRELSEMADTWMDQDFGAQIPETHSGLTKVFCGSCGSVMHTEKLGKDCWQHVCSACGVSGPRADSPEEAVTAALDLFPD